LGRGALRRGKLVKATHRGTANLDAIPYSQVCDHYRDWMRKLDIVMRQTHRAGEKMFLDFAGESVPIRNRASGEIEDAYV